MENNLKKKNVKSRKKAKRNVWPLKVLMLAISLSLGFSIISEIVLGSTGLVVAIVVIVVTIANATNTTNISTDI